MNYFIPRRRPFQVVRLDLKDLLREMTGYFPFSFSRSLSGFSLVRYFALRSYPTPSGYGIALPFVGPLTDYDLFLFLTCKNFEPFRSFGRFRIIFIESFPDILQPFRFLSACSKRSHTGYLPSSPSFGLEYSLRFPEG